MTPKNAGPGTSRITKEEAEVLVWEKAVVKCRFAHKLALEHLIATENQLALARSRELQAIENGGKKR